MQDWRYWSPILCGIIVTIVVLIVVTVSTFNYFPMAFTESSDMRTSVQNLKFDD